jgi:hypothetical protein
MTPFQFDIYVVQRLRFNSAMVAIANFSLLHGLLVRLAIQMFMEFTFIC